MYESSGHSIGSVRGTPYMVFFQSFLRSELKPEFGTLSLTHANEPSETTRCLQARSALASWGQHLGLWGTYWVLSNWPLDSWSWTSEKVFSGQQSRTWWFFLHRFLFIIWLYHNLYYLISLFQKSGIYWGGFFFNFYLTQWAAVRIQQPPM